MQLTGPASGNITLGAVATAVTALGNGWSAQVVGDANDYAKWPSIDLYVSNGAAEGQGALTARGANAELKQASSKTATTPRRHG